VLPSLKKRKMEGKLSCGCTSKLKARGLCQKHYDVQRSLDKLIRSGDQHCNKVEPPQQQDRKPVQVIPVSNAFLQTLTDKFKFKTTTSTSQSSDITCMLSPHIAITSSPQHECMATQSSSPTLHLPPLCVPTVDQILALQRTSFHSNITTTLQKETTKIEIQKKEEERVSIPVTTNKATTITVDTTQSTPDVSAPTTSSTAVLALILLSQSHSVEESKKTEKLQEGYKCQIDGCKKEYITIQSLVGHSVECHGVGSTALLRKRSMPHNNTSVRPAKKQKVKIK